MGLLDSLTGAQTGPSGQQAQGAGSLSPIIMALLGMLAPKALNSSGGQPSINPTSGGANPGGLDDILSGLSSVLSGQKTGTGGGLSGLLAGGLGSLLGGGGSMGSIFSNGLGDLLKQFQQSGQGDVMRSWIGKGPNQAISPGDLQKALGDDQIKTLTAHSGLSRVELLATLSQRLPDVIDKLTPEGRLPSEQELSRML